MALFKDLIFWVFFSEFFENFSLFSANLKDFLEFMLLTRLSNFLEAVNDLVVVAVAAKIVPLVVPMDLSLVLVLVVAVAGVECVHEKEKEMGILL